MTTKHQEIVDKWLANSASFDEMEWLWSEAVHDSEILEYMQTVAGVQKVLSEKQAHIHVLETQNRTKKTNLSYWIAAAALVLISVVAGLMLKLDRNAHQFGMQTIDLIELESGNVTRSNVGSISAVDSLLNLGLKATVEGKKAKAILLFDELLQKYPESTLAAVASLNLGILQFNEGKFSEALASFDNCLSKNLTDEFVVEKAQWFKTYTLINLKELAKARESAIQVYMQDGSYRKQAFVMIKRLDQELKLKTFEDDFELEKQSNTAD